MIDWAGLEELYKASQSDNQRVRETAERAIAESIDGWLAEYLPSVVHEHDAFYSSGYKKGSPMFKDYDDLAAWVTNWLWRGSGGPTWDEYCKRAEELKKDRLGILLRHRKHERARKLHRDHWRFCTIYGDRYLLDLAPPVLPGDPTPQYQEFVLPDTDNA
jgi:hypothetical protein